MEELPLPKLIQEFQQTCKISSNPKYLLNTTFIEHRNFFLSTLFLIEQKSNTIITIDKSLFFSPHFSSTTLNFPWPREQDFKKISYHKPKSQLSKIITHTSNPENTW